MRLKLQILNNPKIKAKYPLDHNITLEDLRSSLVAFNIYFDSFKLTRIRQMPKRDILDLISNFGGILGLFLGLSFLSFAEIIQAICEILTIYFRK
jgi:hypothetical protein